MSSRKTDNDETTADLATSPARPTHKTPPITRPSLHSEVLGRLRALIIEGSLSPGGAIPELAICKQLGISRTPLREALKALAAEGLVTLIPRRGAIVTKLDAQMAGYIFQVLETLEPLAGELACIQMPQLKIDEVTEWHTELIRCHERNDRDGYFRLNKLIHEAIVNGCGNPVLITIYDGLGSRAHYLRYMADLSPTSWQQAVNEHSEILEALVARNGKKLARILRRHLRHKRQYVKHALP